VVDGLIDQHDQLGAQQFFGVAISAGMWAAI
jgi:hypothetical protein